MKKMNTRLAHKKFSKTKKIIFFVLSFFVFIFLVILGIYFYDPCFGCFSCDGDCCYKCCSDCEGIPMEDFFE